MVDQRILLIGGVSLVRGRVREAGPVMREICDELEPMLQGIGFLDKAPFKTISMIIRFGEKDDLTPQYDRINARHSELLVGVELELSGLRTASKDVVKAAFVTATIDVLLDVSEKYGLPNSPLKAMAGQ